MRAAAAGTAILAVAGLGFLRTDRQRYLGRGPTLRDAALPYSLFARTGPGRLQIVTCGGSYLPDKGGYQENIVVTAAPG